MSRIAVGIPLFIIVVLAGITARVYPGSLVVYLLFTIVFNTLLFSGISDKRIFFDTFLGLFLWLGFWFKLSVGISFMHGQFGEPIGGFDWSGAAYDRALIVASIAGIAFLVSQAFRKYLFARVTESRESDSLALESFYLKHRALILSAFAALVLFFSISNLILGVYQRGLTPRTVLPFGLSGVYTLMLLFGLASVSAVILNIELKRKSAPYLVSFLCVLECFLSNVSMFSRGMILNGTALVLGALERMKRTGRSLSLKYGLIAITSFVIIFLFSVVTVNYIRLFTFNKTPASAEAPVMPDRSVANSTPLRSFINRWVGIEGVLAVSSHAGLGWGLWHEAWGERYSSSGTSLYDSKIVAHGNNYLIGNMEGKHFITLPGLIAFLYYPGSKWFLFLGAFLAYALAALIEVFVFKVAGGNVILCSLIGQVLASRYAHFGYVPRQGYLLLAGVLGVALSIFVFEWFISNRAEAERRAQ